MNINYTVERIPYSTYCENRNKRLQITDQPIDQTDQSRTSMPDILTSDADQILPQDDVQEELAIPQDTSTQMQDGPTDQVQVTTTPTPIQQGNVPVIVGSSPSVNRSSSYNCCHSNIFGNPSQKIHSIQQVQRYHQAFKQVASLRQVLAKSFQQIKKCSEIVLRKFQNCLGRLPVLGKSYKTLTLP